MGIIADFSEWQGTIDWAKVSEAHQNGTLDGVILRVQHGYTHPDSRYKEYVAGCKQYGIPFATYAYFAGVSVADSIAEAKSAAALTDKDSKGFIVDIETVSMTDLVSGGQAFVDYMKQAGFQNVGTYSGKNFYEVHNLAAIKADWHWVAAYGPNDGQPHTAPNIGEQLWQFTSVGHIAGVNTNVDESQEENGFNLFSGVTHVATPVSTPTPSAATSDPLYQFCTKQNILQILKATGHTDIRTAPRHDAHYVRDTQAGELFQVFDKYIDANGHCWDNLGGANWVDEISGVFYWVDNPALKQAPAPAPQPEYHTVVSGDTVSALAVHYGSTVAQIKSWNNLDGNYTIYVGKSIRVK